MDHARDHLRQNPCKDVPNLVMLPRSARPVRKPLIPWGYRSTWRLGGGIPPPPRQEQMEREREELREEAAREKSARAEARRVLDASEQQLEKEQRDSSKWRNMIIQEQEFSADLQKQLADEGKARHEARRAEAARTREVERLRRQLEMAGDAQARADAEPAPIGTPPPELDDELRQECEKLREQLVQAHEAASRPREGKPCPLVVSLGCAAKDFILVRRPPSGWSERGLGLG